MTSDTAEPIWLDVEIALAVHDRQLAEHGGGTGVRDQGMLDSALARPVNRWSYGETDLAALAAAYAFGIARNHPFVDGNKRMAWISARLFLALNQVKLKFNPEDAIRATLALAAGEIGEEEIAEWFRERVTRDQPAGNLQGARRGRQPVVRNDPLEPKRNGVETDGRAGRGA